MEDSSLLSPGQGLSKRPKPLIQQRNNTSHKSRARSNTAVKQLSHGFTMSTGLLKKPISENTKNYKQNLSRCRRRL